MELKIKSSKITLYVLIAIYCGLLSFGAFFNICINFLGKGEVWDIYPISEIFWVVISIIVSLKTKNFRLLIYSIIIYVFLDSFMDLAAMGHQSWWAGPPILIEWKWELGSAYIQPLLQQYWFFKWTFQVPVRFLAIAVVIRNPFTNKKDNLYGLLVILLILLGLSISWAGPLHDVFFHFVWWGKYDLTYPYFVYLPPWEGFWNLYNVLFFRIPLCFGVGIILIYLARKIMNIKGMEHLTPRKRLEREAKNSTE